MAKSPEAMTEAMILNLKEKTGKTLPQWLKVAAAAKMTKHGELVKFLKTEHQLTHGYASLVAHKSLGSDAGSAGDSEDLVAAQYAGAKSALRPIYTKLIAAVAKFGEVDVSPKKAYVSLRAKKQFAIIQPSTSTRVDVGINLKEAKPAGRLEASGSFNSMVTHRVRVESPKDVDAELIGWLKLAYQAAV